MPPSYQDHQHNDDVNAHLEQVEALLQKHALEQEVLHRQEGMSDARQPLVETLLHKRHLAELEAKLDGLHPADIAYILEALPIKQRLVVWNLVKAELDGDILLEVSDAVRESLLANMNPDEMRAAAGQLDMDELADIAQDLPQNVMRDVFHAMSIDEREQLRAAMSYPENAVGALMDFSMIQVREDISLEVVSRYLRRFDELPDHTDQVFVVDRDEHFKGVLPINLMVVNEPDVRVAELMIDDVSRLHPDDMAEKAAQMFERYDLISAPVVDEDGKLVGRVSVNVVLDFVRAESENDLLNQAGLLEEEDLFASVWERAKNRWLWLAINLCTAFFASRVIGSFEGTIEKFVALATLMPIVAGLAGNSANQTTAIVIRSLALGLITSNNTRRLLVKELGISVLNGVVWGSAAGLFAYLLYDSVLLGVVMTSAIMFNLLVGAVVGMFIPLFLQKTGRDPAIGSSVMITAITDSGGFFIFLGLATIFLV